MKIVVAPAEFKGTLSAGAAARALAAGARAAFGRAEVVVCPIADGGGGTAGVVEEALDPELVQTPASTPAGRPGMGAFLWLPDDVAFVELASASGLTVAQEEGVSPLRASTRGTGDIVAAALERGPRRIIVGMGGSATSDGGSGIAEALGIRMLESSGAAIGPGAEGLLKLAAVDISERLPTLESVVLQAACDVNNPLLGPQGAAFVFGPQKGADPHQVDLIEEALVTLADVVERDLGVRIHHMPMAGAAGGAAGGMHALLGAELVPGFDLISELIGFDRTIRGADLLIVGEGKLDGQSLQGKAPIEAARKARKAGVRSVWAFAGSVELSRTTLAEHGIDTAIDLGKAAGEESVTEPEEVLARVAGRALSRGPQLG